MQNTEQNADSDLFGYAYSYCKLFSVGIYCNLSVSASLFSWTLAGILSLLIFSIPHFLQRNNPLSNGFPQMQQLPFVTILAMPVLDFSFLVIILRLFLS
jgi:hypothetical protein